MDHFQAQNPRNRAEMTQIQAQDSPVPGPEPSKYGRNGLIEAQVPRNRAEMVQIQALDPPPPKAQNWQNPGQDLREGPKMEQIQAQDTPKGPKMTQIQAHDPQNRAEMAKIQAQDPRNRSEERLNRPKEAKTCHNRPKTGQKQVQNRLKQALIF